jgi:hypothetical protein
VTDTESEKDDREPAVTQAASGSGRTVSRVLLGVATIVAIVASLTIWIHTQGLDTDEWVETSTELLDEPELREALAEHIVDSLYLRVDVAAGMAELLPEDLEGLAGPIAATLRGPATDAVDRLLRTDEIQTLWALANRTAHETMVRVLRDETRPGLSTAEGEIVLDLGEIVATVGERLGLSASRLESLPPDAGQIVIFESDELDTAQKAVEILDLVAWFLFVAVVALYLAAVYFDPNHRREAVRDVGLSLLAVGVVVLLVRQLAVRVILDALIEDPLQRSRVGVAAYVATDLLREIGWSALFYGLLIVLFAALFGEHSWAVAVRRAISPAFNQAGGRAVVVSGVLLLLFLWWSPGRAFERWPTALTFVVLAGVGLYVLARRTRREFPEVTFGEVLRSPRAATPSSP